jgi:hypothetical protein
MRFFRAGPPPEEAVNCDVIRCYFEIFYAKFTGCFHQFFSGMDDPRSWKNQTHNFITLIGTTFCAVLSGVDSFSGIADFVEMHFAELSQYFDLSGGIPSHGTYQRFWNAISPSQFRDHFVEFIESLKKVCSEIISLDGKTIRNSGKDKPLHIVSAWCQNNQMVFAQEKVHEKSNEITAIPELLKKLDLTGKIITIDAMGAQRDICQQIIEGGGDYVISLKGNQGTLHEDAKLFFEDEDIPNHKKNYRQGAKQVWAPQSRGLCGLLCRSAVAGL